MRVVLKESGPDRMQTFDAILRKSPEAGGGVDDTYENPRYGYNESGLQTAVDGSSRIAAVDGKRVTLEYLGPSPVEQGPDGQVVPIPSMVGFLVDSDATEGEQLIGSMLEVVCIPDNATSVEFERVANPVIAEAPAEVEPETPPATEGDGK